MADEAQQARPYAADDVVCAQVHETAREIDRILHRQPVENHAAILGVIQVTTERRMHEHRQREKKKIDEAQAEIARRQKFGA